MSAAAFALHAVALSGAMLALVQPIIVSGLVFGVFVRAALERRLPQPSTIGWCTLTWAGLATFIAVLHTGPPQPPDLRHAAYCVVVGFILVASTLAALSRVRSEERRGLLYGAAAGIFFGLVAGLVKVILDQDTSRWWSIAAHWPFWALVVVGVVAISLNQHAFQATRLSVSMPMVNIADVLVAITFGVIVFGEPLYSTPLTLVVEVLGLLAMAVGVRQLARRGERPEHLLQPQRSEPATTTDQTLTLGER
jgi:uncharacterized membrane protein YoaK (UPF0700 family)